MQEINTFYSVNWKETLEGPGVGTINLDVMATHKFIST